MVENVKYYRYQENEEAEELVRMFFYAGIYDWTQWFPELLQKDKSAGCIGVSDFQFCVFPGFYDEDEPEYFGKTGVMIFVNEPAAAVDSAVYLTNAEYFAEVSKWAPKYLERFPEDAEEVAELLEKLRIHFGL